MRRIGWNRSLRRVPLVLVPLSLLLSLLLIPSSAGAAVATAPSWQVTDVGIPTVLPAGLGKTVRYDVVAENVGGAATSSTYTIKDDVPAGISVTEVHSQPSAGSCETVGREVTCSYTEPVAPGGFVVMTVFGVVSGSTAGGLADVGSVSGGGAPAASSEAVMRAGAKGEKGPGGISEFKMTATGPTGEPVTQAGGHPQFLTTSVLLNNQYIEGAFEPIKPVEAVKDIVFYLPLGMLGNTTVANYCPPAIVETREGATGCPPSSEVGSILPLILSSATANQPNVTHEAGIFNLAPEQGYAAEFAFASNNYTFNIYANVVYHDGAYMIRVATPGLPTIAALIGLVSTFNGDLSEKYTQDGTEDTLDRGAFLTNPSDCGEGQQAREASVATDRWERPGVVQSRSSLVFPALEGCGLLSFSSALSAGPDPRVAGDSTAADEPSGYKVSLEVPQAPSGALSLGTPPYEGVNFTFPLGTSLSPGAANGLTACAASGPQGIDFPTGEGVPGPPGTPAGEGEEEAADGLPQPVAGHCPASSQVGSVSAVSPVLPAGRQELKGHLYLAEPGCGNAAHPNACTPQDAADGNLYRLYLELEQAQSGVVIKLAGKALVNPGTGQITSVFEDTPQFPVGDLTLETTGGPRAGMANPQTCGTATTTGAITPWSGGVPSEPAGSFQVNEGCGAQGFAPSLTAGTTNSQAGAFSPFTLTLKREDREQDIGSLSTTLPAGLLAAVSKVAQCPEPQASQGTCSEASRVGSATVGIGAGSEPFYQSGQVYFTGPYNGAPFGLSIVTPAVAGPFNLGTVVTRVALSINPVTAQVTARTDGSGPYAIPRIIDGVPLRIRTVNVTLNNPAFTFNPTSCAKQSILGTAYSTQGTPASISAPFEATGCQGLAFKPVLKASTQAQASKANGTSLVVKITSGAGQANIGKVDLQLPKQLSSRLTTLQKACTEAQFNANPAGCPEASFIGTAKAITPVLNVPLAGPAILVSHGGAAFPDVVFVLQGEGVRIDLDGGTQIKGKVTYSRFETVPDAPISSFETTLPAGPHSVLGTNVPEKDRYNLCGQKLTMPTTITGQNGAVINQDTAVSITGCPKVKSLTRAQKLAAALKACRKKAKGKRAACEKAARKKYGAAKKASRASHVNGGKEGK